MGEDLGRNPLVVALRQRFPDLSRAECGSGGGEGGLGGFLNSLMDSDDVVSSNGA